MKIGDFTENDTQLRDPPANELSKVRNYDNLSREEFYAVRHQMHPKSRAKAYYDKLYGAPDECSKDLITLSFNVIIQDERKENALIDFVIYAYNASKQDLVYDFSWNTHRLTSAVKPFTGHLSPVYSIDQACNVDDISVTVSRPQSQSLVTTEAIPPWLPEGGVIHISSKLFASISKLVPHNDLSPTELARVFSDHTQYQEMWKEILEGSDTVRKLSNHVSPEPKIFSTLVPLAPYDLFSKLT